MKKIYETMVMNNILIMLIIVLMTLIFCISTIVYHEKAVAIKTSINNLEWENADLKLDIQKIKRSKMNLKVELREMKKEMEQDSLRIQKVKITFYCPSLGGINSDSNPSKTALMRTPQAGWTCAISRDLVELGWLGRAIYIKGLGIRYAEDIMGKSINGKKITKQIDIMVGKNDLNKEIKKFGKNKDILASLI